MGQFERPKNTICDAAELRVGDVLWHVSGIWPPQMGINPHRVTRAACTLREYEGDTSGGSQSGSIVFETKYGDWPPSMSFASDGNMVPGHSHNDNYWFRSEADAIAAVEHLKTAWTADPELVPAEIERRREEDALWRALDREMWDEAAE